MNMVYARFLTSFRTRLYASGIFADGRPHKKKKKSNDKLPNNLKLPKGEVNPIMKASVPLRPPASKPGSQISPFWLPCD